MFLATGAVLTFDRLSRGAGGLYAAVLALKVACAVVTYQFAFRWRRVGLPVGGLDGRILLIFGAATVFLAAVLKGVSESGVSSSTKPDSERSLPGSAATSSSSSPGGVIALAVAYLVAMGLRGTTEYFLTVSELQAQGASAQNQVLRGLGHAGARVAGA